MLKVLIAALIILSMPCMSMAQEDWPETAIVVKGKIAAGPAL